MATLLVFLFFSIKVSFYSQLFKTMNKILVVEKRRTILDHMK
jgi:hypothetical protein